MSRLALLVYLLFLLGVPAVGAHAQGAAGQESLALNPLRAIEKSSLAGFHDKPLFDPAREARSPAALAPAFVPPPVTPRPLAPPPNLALSGIILGEEDLAVVRMNGADPAIMLATGDHVGDWTVTVLPPHGLRLKDHGRTVEFGLFTHDTVVFEPQAR